MKDSRLVEVGSFLNRMEAELAQGALQAAEIESVVSAGRRRRASTASLDEWYSTARESRGRRTRSGVIRRSVAESASLRGLSPFLIRRPTRQPTLEPPQRSSTMSVLTDATVDSRHELADIGAYETPTTICTTEFGFAPPRCAKGARAGFVRVLIWHPATSAEGLPGAGP